MKKEKELRITVAGHGTVRLTLSFRLDLHRRQLRGWKCCLFVCTGTPGCGNQVSSVRASLTSPSTDRGQQMMPANLAPSRHWALGPDFSLAA